MGISIGVTVILLLYVLAMGATFWFCVMAGTCPSLFVLISGVFLRGTEAIYCMRCAAFFHAHTFFAGIIPIPPFLASFLPYLFIFNQQTPTRLPQRTMSPIPCPINS